MQTVGDSRLGTVIENYKLLSVLGSGSMSVVYLAQRVDDPRVLVAMKILRYPDVASAEDLAAFRMRFQREARAASELRNEHILPVLASGNAGDMPYMVMPVIVGGTLATRLSHQTEPMPLNEIAGYLNQLASAIDYAHDQGVIHRDIKPANILLDEHGHIYLTDFGIARLFDSGENALTREGSATLTRPGQVLGTPYYMAPEQIQGKPVGPEADIYALGVVLYQMVTGQVPFHGDTPLAVALQHLQEVPHSPALLRHELPAPVEAVILQALAKDPADRYASATALAEAFEAGLTELDDPMETQLPSQAWPFSTRYASGSATMSVPQPETPAPRTRAKTESLSGLTLDGYHTETIIESDDLGVVFTARRDGSPDPVRIRFLAMPADTSPKQLASYGLRFEEQASNLAVLRHPNLMPMLGYGIYEGRPYIITPDMNGVTLSTELAQHGALELSPLADYLDQIVAGLESAHRRGFLHLSLTPDRVYRQEDGRVIITDIGLRGILDDETAEATATRNESSAITPEQLEGEPVGPYTDVYALGAMLYLMLTGREAFSGATREDIANEHLHSTIPPLRRWRPNLPTTLDRVVSQAMAKTPERRFQTPRELAAAYHAAIAHIQQDGALAPSYSAMRRSPTESVQGASYGAVGGSARGMSAAQTSAGRGVADARGASTPDFAGSFQQAQTGAGGGAATSQRAAKTTVPLGATNRKTRIAFTALGVLLLVSLVAAGLVWYRGHTGTVKAGGTLATATFFDSNAGGYNTDALKIDVTALAAPSAGHWYEVWLINDQTERVTALGKLVPQQGKTDTYTLAYDGSNGQGQPGANLLGAGDRIRITNEAQKGALPAGPVVMEGTFPPHSFVHVQHLLVAFPTTPQHEGLMVGMMQQLDLLHQQANVLQQWIGLHYPKSTQCAAQSMVDIIEGKSGAHYKALGPICDVSQPWPAGDGYGLLGSDGYLAGVADHAALAANADDATPQIRARSEHVQIAVQNVTGWLQTTDQDALSILAGSNDPNMSNMNMSSDVMRLPMIALTGQDTNADGSVDPVKGEAGAELAYANAQQLATLSFGPTH